MEIAERRVVVSVSMGGLQRDAAIEEFGHFADLTHALEGACGGTQPTHADELPEHALGAVRVRRESALREAEGLGAGEVLLTSWDRDGTRSGYDLELLAEASQAVRLPVIASGGASSPEHMAQALSVGASAVLAASIFHDNDMTCGQVKDALRESGIEVRT